METDYRNCGHVPPQAYAAYVLVEGQSVVTGARVCSECLEKVRKHVRRLTVSNKTNGRAPVEAPKLVRLEITDEDLETLEKLREDPAREVVIKRVLALSREAVGTPATYTWNKLLRLLGWCR